MFEGRIPAITTEQMQEVDRLMIDVYHIELIQMMENAGWNLAELARFRFLDGDPNKKRVLVLAGSGGNGGGGLVAARRLHNWGAKVQVYTTMPDGRMRAVPAHQLDILRQIGTPVYLAKNIKTLPPSDLIIDAVIGYSLQGVPKGTSAQLIEMGNTSMDAGTPILSLDVPSGMDSTTGKVREPFIRAAATMTLALPKAGLMTDHAKPFVGELFLADIGVPPGLYRDLDLDIPPIFATEEIIRVC
jgi:NAD(P)H-hydrate epimerase